MIQSLCASLLQELLDWLCCLQGRVDTDTSSWLAMTFKLSWGTPIHFGQWHFTLNLLPKIIQHPRDSCTFLSTVHLSNKSLLGTATIQTLRLSDDLPLSKLGYKEAESSPFLSNTNIWKNFDFLCKLPSDAYTLCWHKLWKSAASLYGCRYSI